MRYLIIILLFLSCTKEQQQPLFRAIKISRKGVSRIVFLIGNIAIKIPNFTVQHDHFLIGCLANWTERKRTKESCDDYFPKIAPTYFCSWFGLVSIQKRVVELGRDLDWKERTYFINYTTDLKKENFGYIKNQVVCIDYA